jgi:uncharacterized protein DUF4062
VIVFISSVRRGLESERGYLPSLLQASGYEARRFEDFSAQPSPSRDACLAGVEAADVYLLLLGEHFGEPLPDTGKAPTEEEFTVAKRRGIPILVFRKTGIDPGERQRDFIARAGDYQQGRFWKEFGDNGQLAVVVLQALREVAAEAAPLRWGAGRCRARGAVAGRQVDLEGPLRGLYTCAGGSFGRPCGPASAACVCSSAAR